MEMKYLRTACTLLMATSVTALLVSNAWGKSPCGHRHSECGKHSATLRGAPQSAEPRISDLDLPPEARPGECYAKVFIPAEFKTISERVCIREASEKLEVVPAKFETVEERVMVREGSVRLEYVPAEFKTEERQVCVRPGHSGWVRQSGAQCIDKNNEKTAARDVFCLVNTPPEFKTVSVQTMIKPACVREVRMPAEYQTVTREKLACKAYTRRVTIPAEFDTVEKTVAVAPASMRWERVICEASASGETMNQIKDSLASAGYPTGPKNGRLDQTDWSSLEKFQEKNRLGLGALTLETLDKLHVTLK